MSEKKGMYEKAKSEMRLSERIVAALPGFRGYKEKELRRESDKLIRNHIYLRLSEARKDLKVAFQKLSDSKMEEVLTDMDRFIMRFDRVAQKINHASYGYTGFFNIVKVEESKLDEMIDYDNGLVDQVEKIIAEADGFRKEVAKQKLEKTRDHLDNLEEMLESLEEAFDGRDEVIKGVK